MYNKFHKINLSGPFGDFPDHLLLAGVKNKETSSFIQRFHEVPDQANQDFFWYPDCIFRQLYVLLSI